MKKNIEKKDAKRNWEHPLKKIALQKIFVTFDEYWKECEKFNLLNEEDKYKYKTEATKFLKMIKTNNALRELKGKEAV